MKKLRILLIAYLTETPCWMVTGQEECSRNHFSITDASRVVYVYGGKKYIDYEYFKH